MKKGIHPFYQTVDVVMTEVRHSKPARVIKPKKWFWKLIQNRIRFSPVSRFLLILQVVLTDLIRDLPKRRK